MTIDPISPVSTGSLVALQGVAPISSDKLATQSFSQLLMDGLGQVDAAVARSDTIATEFVLDDSIPVHQVTFALEQARLAVQMMVQVRTHLLEGYQELMRMQL